MTHDWDALNAYVRKALFRAFAHQFPEAELDDIAQETVKRAFEKREGFRGDSRFTTWATSIGVNLALTRLRRRKFKHVSLDDASEKLSEAARGTATLEVDARNALLSELIKSELSPRQQRALGLELNGASIDELAAHFESTKGAMYKLLHDARKKLKRALDARGVQLSELLEDR